ncbi:MAG: TolC family protein [Bacteroidales bacterium]|nr:TolC family protein [Bacteroidales bacterium]
MKNRFSKTLLTILLVAGMILPGMSQEPAASQELPDQLVLNLQGAVDHAISYNKSLQNARLEVERSRKSIWEAIAQGLPQVDGAVDYMSYFNYEMEFNFGMGEAPSFTPEEMLEAWNQTSEAFPGVTQQDIYNHSAGTYFEGVLQSMMPPTTILLSDQSTAKLQLSQLIFSGQYIVGVQTAKLGQLISEQNYEFNELNIKESVINAYYLVLITKESLDIIEKNVVNLEETLEQTRTMYNAGMAEQTDVDQIRITVNQLANARNALERNLELNYNMLRFQLGIEANVDLMLTDGLEMLYTSMQVESALEVPFIIENNVSYQMMETQEEISKKLVGLEQWNYAPTIAGFYNYNAKILTSGFDMNPNHLVGLNMSVPIFSSGLRKVRVDQARIDYSMAQTNKSILEDQLTLQEKQFKYNLQSSLENFFTQQENVEVAQSVYDSYRRKFEQGMATSLDLTQANNNYLDAESNYLTAILEVMNAKLQLDKLMNNL